MMQVNLDFNKLFVSKRIPFTSYVFGLYIYYFVLSKPTFIHKVYSWSMFLYTCQWSIVGSSRDHLRLLQIQKKIFEDEVVNQAWIGVTATFLLLFPLIFLFCGFLIFKERFLQCIFCSLDAEALTNGVLEASVLSRLLLLFDLTFLFLLKPSFCDCFH